jgi:drug/metabolite transporter (DMT)-like permease
MVALPQDPVRRQALLGMACAVAGSASFSVNDTTIKFLSGDYALHQVVLFRSTFGMAFVLAFLLPWQGGLAALRTAQPGKHALRGLCVVLSNVFYFLGLAALPLADTAAIFFVAPLMIAALSVPLLGERVGPRRWAAVGVGLAGVVVMMRPGSGSFHWALLLPVASALFYALMHIMTRRMGGRERAVTMVLYVQLSFVIVSALMGLAFGGGAFEGSADPSLGFLFRAWAWPPPGDFALLALIGVSSATGGLFIAQAYRLCEASLVAPFEYTAIPLAILGGWLVFGEWPAPQAFIGIALICGSGLYALWREGIRRAGRT